MRELAHNFVNDSALQSTKREMQRLLVSRSFWLPTVAAALLLGLTGPFGTYLALSLPLRLTYWALVGVASYLTGYGTVSLLANLHGRERSRHPLFWAAYGAIAGLPVALIVWALNAALFGRAVAPALPELTGLTMAVSAIVSVAVALSENQASAMAQIAVKATGELSPAQAASSKDTSRGDISPGDHGAAAPSGENGQSLQTQERPKILDRLPSGQRGRLSHMSMQDHYVDVRTDRGGGLVLMRFSDAIAETAGVDGLQIHRSHWIARTMTEGPARLNGKPAVRMQDGSVLPVSRSYIAVARAAGLI